MTLYRIQLPTKEQCAALGVKFEGQALRTRLWLLGFASGVSFCNRDDIFNLNFTTDTHFYVECNNNTIINSVRDYLKPYGITVKEINPLPQGSAIPYNHTASWAQKV